MTDRPNDRMTDRPHDRPNDRPTDRPTESNRIESNRSRAKGTVAASHARARFKRAMSTTTSTTTSNAFDDGEDGNDGGEGEISARARASLGLRESLMRATRALDAANVSAQRAQDALIARVEDASKELERLVDALPTPAREEDAKRLRTARTKLDGIGLSAKNLRERVEKLHNEARNMNRADLRAVLESGGELPARGEAFRTGREAAEAMKALKM